MSKHEPLTPIFEELMMKQRYDLAELFQAYGVAPECQFFHEIVWSVAHNMAELSHAGNMLAAGDHPDKHEMLLAANKVCDKLDAELEAFQIEHGEFPELRMLTPEEIERINNPGKDKSKPKTPAKTRAKTKPSAKPKQIH